MATFVSNMRSKTKVELIGAFLVLTLLFAANGVFVSTPGQGAIRTAIPDYDYCGGPVTITGHYTDLFGFTVLTTKLTSNWKYNFNDISWYTNPPEFSTHPVIPITWADSLHVGVFKIDEANDYQAYGSGRYEFGIPTPWGTIGLNQPFDSTINMYKNGSYVCSVGSSYITS